MGRKQEELKPVTVEEKALAGMPQPDGLPELDEKTEVVDYGAGE